MRYFFVQRSNPPDKIHTTPASPSIEIQGISMSKRAQETHALILSNNQKSSACISFTTPVVYSFTLAILPHFSKKHKLFVPIGAKEIAMFGQAFSHFLLLSALVCRNPSCSQAITHPFLNYATIAWFLLYKKRCKTSMSYTAFIVFNNYSAYANGPISGR